MQFSPVIPDHENIYLPKEILRKTYFPQKEMHFFFWYPILVKLDM